MTTSYHPTGHTLTQAQLSDYERRAQTQEEKILAYVRTRLTRFTVEDLEDRVVLPVGTPHSSYIRAVSNLRRWGYVEAYDQTTGRYNRPIHIYRLRPGVMN
ncbi:MAG: hypothetical protein WC489_07910 [Patescibacteria group bacterium]|nr:hypothetical protein [Methanoregulaceae archaeon]MDD5049645.1 hypothetical protein [Methanoregulaceae archaeon]